MIPWYSQLGITVLVFMLAVYWHEQTHIIRLKKYGIKSRVRFTGKDFSVKYNPLLLTKEQERNIIGTAVLIGMVPLLFLLVISSVVAYHFGIVALMIYLAMCRHDLRRLRDIERKTEEKI